MPSINLPTLLASLPASSSKSVLVKPISFPSNSFYKVSRTAIKYRSQTGKGKENTDAWDKLDEVKAGGKAWGTLFWKGKPISPISPSASATPPIPHSRKYSWTTVDPASLDSALQEELAKVEQTALSHEAQRRSLLEEKRSGKKERRREKAQL